MSNCIARSYARFGVGSSIRGQNAKQGQQSSPIAATHGQQRLLLGSFRRSPVGLIAGLSAISWGLGNAPNVARDRTWVPQAAVDEAPPATVASNTESSGGSSKGAGAGSLQASSGRRIGGRGGGKGGKGGSKGPVVISESRYEDAGLSVRAEQRGEECVVLLQLSSPRPLVLHWGLDEWAAPPAAAWPPGTTQVDSQACQTPFGADGSLQLAFPGDATPSRVVFVLKQLASEQGAEVWFNNSGGNYAVQLRAPPLESFVEKVLTAEGSYSHWSLPQRLMLATEVLEAADAAGPPGMSFLFTWLRLSSTRVLDWYRKANFQPKDVASMQRHAGERIAEKARSASDPLNRLFARGALAGLPRGGGNGDEIRMGILHIMRGHGIKEGHRPGHDEPFLEQWHQKLHTNTTPDDVAICEAYLAFLHSGNHDDYWRVLWDSGRLTREMMQSWPKPVSAWPQHLPHLIPAFQHYLWILKTTHSGADLDTAMEMAKGHMDEDLRWVIFDILSHRNEWWVPGKIVEARSRLAHYWKAPGSSRDLLLLDIALEGWFRTCLERTDWGRLGGDDLLELVALVLRGALISPDDADLGCSAALWERLRASSHCPLPGERWGRQWALAALAAAERLQLSVAAHMDALHGLVQPHADSFGSACRLAPQHTVNFGEEVVRGQPLFLAALLLGRLEPMLREAAGGAAWQIVSLPAPGSGPLAGEVVAVGALAEVQGAAFNRPTVLLAASLSGVEDIPAGVVAVLTRSSTDVLSHLAIRARSQRVLLATCFDEAAWRAWQDIAATAAPGTATATDGSAAGEPAAAPASAASAAARTVAVVVDPAVGNVMPADPPAAPAFAVADSSAVPAADPRVTRIVLQAPQRTSAWALAEADFQTGLVGAKALNLASLRRALKQSTTANGNVGDDVSSSISVPVSVALPYGTFERVLTEERRNATAAAEVRRLVAAAAEVAAGGALPREELEALRQVVENDLVAPPELVRQLAAVAAAQGLIPSAASWEAYADAHAADADDDSAAFDDDADDAITSSSASASSSPSSSHDGGDGAAEEFADAAAGPSGSSSSSSSWPAVWRAVCRVWASKWTDRAWLSRRALGIREEELFMSVLLQQVVPFQYAFVLHTSNPVTHKQGELLGELVLGMGETLVGNYPGRALGFTAEAREGAQPELISFPSKRVALHPRPGPTPMLIARSDANAEDLEQYAAAGLYDSVTLQPLEARPADYAHEPLLGDPAFRGALLGRLAGLGRAVAGAFGGRDQDVEGGVLEGRLYVVQARPQVELGGSSKHQKDNTV